MKGFGVRVTSGGTKAFFVEKLIKKKLSRITLGRYPELTVEMARKEGQIVLGQIVLGQIATGADPVAEKHAQKMRAMTLNDVFQDYIQVRKSLKHNTLYTYKEDLLSFSSNLDRDLNTLVLGSKLKKPATGLYYKPKQSCFGLLPPTDKSLVKGFLHKPFLIYSWSDYNKLGLGLTQLYNKVVVYNGERHEDKKLGNRIFSFKRPNNGFSTKLTKEFLLVNLLKSAKYLTEDVSQLKLKVAKNLQQFDRSFLRKLSTKYGKVATRKYLQTLIGN